MSNRYSPKIAAYFKSEAWADKRLTRLRIDGFACRLCGARNVVLEVHHKPGSYALIPNESVEDDLTTLCKTCHEMFHKSWDRRKKAWTTNTTRPTKNSTPSSVKNRQSEKKPPARGSNSRKWTPF